MLWYFRQRCVSLHMASVVFLGEIYPGSMCLSFRRILSCCVWVVLANLISLVLSQHDSNLSDPEFLGLSAGVYFRGVLQLWPYVGHTGFARANFYHIWYLNKADMHYYGSCNYVLTYHQRSCPDIPCMPPISSSIELAHFGVLNTTSSRPRYGTVDTGGTSNIILTLDTNMAKLSTWVGLVATGSHLC